MNPETPSGGLNVLASALLKLLRPLVRILLRQGMPLAAFVDLAKRVYVEIALEDFVIPGRKQSLSRVSVLTGLSRKEVKRIATMPLPGDEGASARYNRAARVIGGWLRDAYFHDPTGKPLALPLEHEGPDFSELVKKYSGDVPARAIFDELLRVGAVQRLEDGRIELKTRAYIPSAASSDKLAILGTDVSDLIACIDHNMQCPGEEAFFQRKVSYDNMPADDRGELRRLAAERSQLLLEELDLWMSSHDRDASPSVKGRGRKRASLGVYYFEESLDEDETR
ncbi:MAG: DUF6502 family protein [Candidatus Binatia bacterium]